MIRITVVKRALFEELISDVAPTNKEFSKCEKFTDGQVFLIVGAKQIPEGFCSWAWADIQRDVAMIECGGEPKPKLNMPHSMYSCCSEGLRPVVFKIEKI